MKHLCRFSDTCQETLVTLSTRFGYIGNRTERTPGSLYPGPNQRRYP